MCGGNLLRELGRAGGGKQTPLLLPAVLRGH